MRKILGEREVDIFGLRIGKQVVEIETRATVEIADIHHLLQEQRTRDATGLNVLTEYIDARLASLERNLNREIGQIQQMPAQTAKAEHEAVNESVDSRKSRAAAAERQGFEAVLEQDVQSAIDAFAGARQVWPE